MKYLVIDTSILNDDNGSDDVYIIGIFDTVQDALSARARYYACYPDLNFHSLEICPLRPNKFYEDRAPVACWDTENFKDCEEELLYAISDITD